MVPSRSSRLQSGPPGDSGGSKRAAANRTNDPPLCWKRQRTGWAKHPLPADCQEAALISFI